MEQNETLQTLKTRRSCRSYRPDPIPPAVLDAVLEAGTYAPSARGRQGVQFIVIENAADRAQLSSMNAAILGAKGDPFYGAPVIVAVLAPAASHCAVEDGSVALANLMNAAASLGLGSCWIHRAREEFASAEGKALLKKWGLAGDWVGVGHCILGYPAAEPAAPAPRRPGAVLRV
jgi:nitroreductase